MHFGATLRLLRVDAGLSLRDLAQRVGVSSAYLSRVENGHDAPPTPDRLVAIARALKLPPPALFDLGGRVTSFVSRYLDEVPTANALFADIARRRLTPTEIARLRVLVAHEFPREDGATEPGTPLLGAALDASRVIVGVQGASFEDALGLAAMRLAPACGVTPAQLQHDLLLREDVATTHVGHGVAIPHLVLDRRSPPAAALLTFGERGRPVGSDGNPLRLLVAFVVGRGAGGDSARLLLDAVALARDELVSQLCALRTAEEVLEVVRRDQQLRGAS